jgi:hypothetical protein
MYLPYTCKKPATIQTRKIISRRGQIRHDKNRWFRSNFLFLAWTMQEPTGWKSQRRRILPLGVGPNCTNEPIQRCLVGFVSSTSGPHPDHHPASPPFFFLNFFFASWFSVSFLVWSCLNEGLLLHNYGKFARDNPSKTSNTLYIHELIVSEVNDCSHDPAS